MKIQNYLTKTTGGRVRKDSFTGHIVFKHKTLLHFQTVQSTSAVRQSTFSPNLGTRHWRINQQGRKLSRLEALARQRIVQRSAERSAVRTVLRASGESKTLKKKHWNINHLCNGRVSAEESPPRQKRQDSKRKRRHLARSQTSTSASISAKVHQQDTSGDGTFGAAHQCTSPATRC